MIKELFTEFKFKEFIKFWIVNIIASIYTFFWTLLFIIPGIIASYSYQMAPLIAIENPDMSYNEIISLSKAYTSGFKFHLFTFEMSWLLWAIIVIFTFGVAALYVIPYMIICKMLIYKELKNKKELSHCVDID